MAVSTDWRQAPLAPADYAMLEFTEKLTLSPAAMGHEDVASMRRHGFDDRGILSIVLAAAYRNYITRVADALGVELRSGGGYAPEILRAFGVAEADVGGTIYGDRLAPAEGPATTAPSHPRDRRLDREVSPEACWIDTRPADPARFDAVRDELARLTVLHPRRHLALAFARRPEAFDAALAFGRLVGLGGSGLGPRLEAIIGLTVAAALGVTYMGVHHAQALLDAGATPGEIQPLAARPADGGSAGFERTVAGFCERMARQPGTMGRPDVEAVRAAGFGDQDILTIAAAAAYEAFLCGVAAGLGVRLEDEGFSPAARQTFEAAAPV